MDLNKLYKEIEEAEASLNAKRLKYIKEALAENNGIIKLKFKEFKEFKETNDVLSFHKPQTQIIAIIHNPALIYKLSKLDCVNFIEMTEGYLNKTCIFMSN